MSADAFVDEVERLLMAASINLTTPAPGECLLCFTARMVEEFDCDSTLRWARRYRELRAPRATGLERRLTAVGGYCDCEIFVNGFGLTSTPRRTVDQEGELRVELPACSGVRRASSQPCVEWEPLRRW